MPNRVLREGILTSERVSSLDWPAEVFYRRLMSVVDDFGRYYAKPELLRAACYPLHLDKVGNSDIGKWLADCAGAALVRTYTIEGKEYLELADFRQHQRAVASKFPHPSNGCDAPEPHPPDNVNAGAAQMQRICIASEHVDEDEVEDVVERRKAKAKAKNARTRANRSPQTPISPDFSISDGVRQWAQERGYKRLDEHFEHFVGYAKANGKTYSDWDQALKNAIRDDWAGLRKQNSRAIFTRDEGRKLAAQTIFGSTESHERVIDAEATRVS